MASCGRASALIVLGLFGAVLGMSSCSLDSLVNRDEIPPDLSDPAILQTPVGARAAYAGTLAQFRAAFGNHYVGNGGLRSFIIETGLLTDELSATTFSSGIDPVDQRNVGLDGHLSQGVDAYSALQRVRGQAGQALGLLGQYLPEQPGPALQAHLYAVSGYAEVLLAELFCSGIPLSTLDYGGNITYRPGSSTADVFSHAIALFDTALTLAGDSSRFMDLAWVGRGRALLALGQYANAAAAVAAVPDDFRYNVYYRVTPNENAANFAYTGGGQYQDWPFTVPDREGSTGLDWRSSGDPRTQTTFVASGQPFYTPRKYGISGDSAIVLASGVEARLIEAEAALQAGDTTTWLARLNALRTDGTFDTQPTADPTDDPAALDTLWHAGRGGVAGLKPLTDPGTADRRIDALFRERAFWLFLTGHRQGDLRRLVRQYGRSQDDVYPTGIYPIHGAFYGSDVTVPIPAVEGVNPLFTGCISYGA